MSRLFKEVFRPELQMHQDQLIEKLHKATEQREKELMESPKIKKIIAQLNKLRDQLGSEGITLTMSSWGYNYATGTFKLDLTKRHPIGRKKEMLNELINREFQKLERKAVVADEMSKGAKAEWLVSALTDLKDLSARLEPEIKLK